MPTNPDPKHRHEIEVLRALAYLFSHPEIDSHVKLEWNPVGHPNGIGSYHFTVDAEVIGDVMIRYAGSAVRPMKPLPLVVEEDPSLEPPPMRSATGLDRRHWIGVLRAVALLVSRNRGETNVNLGADLDEPGKKFALVLTGQKEELIATMKELERHPIPIRGGNPDAALQARFREMGATH
ncbi:hypothetical protein UFOVP1383_48 [uncultured Caudovirales phage]|uniref:Uncharacterized protein n=1 Tax=uncultured Caudovirales phage TaxID=2100421 RepID=A0A6J5QDW6_9CAUD|nr:hypothetical protein UFOVP848_52 [uncultured Caudovirales phage]CAB4173057.1 hypothetical protein UFOVP945_13 [uncultured Caudovirales phage]CAB4179641.1 hypothetical protein UFOVP1023_29 [uncultured Caudovirales phage]CAB4204287.1 hypothetical protein UFOVP1383_48 [uncultured Caudovirales phage]CAB4216094.1 hypothetical protein UFOVP1477_59 [uncultured Caudovirales phage]